jgi:uncharacterized membrane protein YqaE (UPF0057 family)
MADPWSESSGEIFVRGNDTPRGGIISGAYKRADLLISSTNLRNAMRLVLAVIIPWLQFFTIGRPIAGIICLLLQITLIGWIPAAIWSVYALSQYKTDRKIERALGERM